MRNFDAAKLLQLHVEKGHAWTDHASVQPYLTDAWTLADARVVMTPDGDLYMTVLFERAHRANGSRRSESHRAT